MIAKYYLRYRSIFGKGARNWNITLTTETKKLSTETIPTAASIPIHCSGEKQHTRLEGLSNIGN